MQYSICGKYVIIFRRYYTTKKGIRVYAKNGKVIPIYIPVEKYRG